MTVKELIEKLSIYDEEQKIEVYCPFITLDADHTDIEVYQYKDVVYIEGNEKED